MALTNDVPRDNAVPSGMSAKGDLNRDGVVTPADAAIALQMAAHGEYSIDADVGDEKMYILQTESVPFLFRSVLDAKILQPTFPTVDR